MPTTAETRELFDKYLTALDGNPKPPELIDQFVSDPQLAQHIAITEAAFPSYRLIQQQVIAEGDTLAFRGMFEGKHMGAFAGVEPTGRTVSAPVMLFYRVANGLLAEHHMVFDLATLMPQLTAAS